jgi:hypothetical protein
VYLSTLRRFYLAFTSYRFSYFDGSLLLQHNEKGRPRGSLSIVGLLRLVSIGKIPPSLSLIISYVETRETFASVAQKHPSRPFLLALCSPRYGPWNDFSFRFISASSLMAYLLEVLRSTYPACLLLTTYDWRTLIASHGFLRRPLSFGFRLQLSFFENADPRSQEPEEARTRVGRARTYREAP